MKETKDLNRPTALFVSHGGGPLPLLGDKGHTELVEGLKDIASQIPKPSTILVVSAHWEEARPTLTHGAMPSLIYDYNGCPKSSYEIEYPAPGHPQLAEKIYSKLRDKGGHAALDNQRGFDHGLFVPLKIMYPEADIPCVQMSLMNSLDPKTHIEIGQALSGLNEEGLLIIGSGFSFHNMSAFFTANSDETNLLNQSFEDWLIDTCSNKKISETERTRRLQNWSEAPGARYCHPREEHLLPLHVCYGVAKKPCDNFIEHEILGKKSSAYLWR